VTPLGVKAFGYKENLQSITTNRLNDQE